MHIPTSPHNPPEGYRLSSLIHQLLSRSALALTSPGDLLSLIRDLDSAHNTRGPDGKDGTQQVLKSSPLHSFTSEGWSIADTAAAAEFWKMGLSVAEALGLRSTKPHLLVNGRVGDRGYDGGTS